MSESKHSPLPWKQNGVSVHDAKGHEVAETWGNQFAKMVLPDAAFIVEAVNSHDKLRTDRDALLDALKALLDDVRRERSGFGRTYETRHAIEEHAQNVIEDAEKEG